MIDDIRTAYPKIGIALYAIEPGAPITLETYTPDGQVFSLVADTAAAALARAFPDLPHAKPERPTCSNTGLPCVPGCDQKTCAGHRVPLNEWPDPEDDDVWPDDDEDGPPAPDAPNVFD